MTVVEVTVTGRPVSQGTLAIGKRKDGSPYVRHGRNERMHAWRRAIKTAVGTRRPFTGPVDVTLAFYFHRPQDHYTRRGLRDGSPAYPVKSSTPDIDKLARAVLDALTGCLIVDDAQVVNLHCRKRYADAGHDERLELRVRPADDDRLFDTGDPVDASVRAGEHLTLVLGDA